MKAQSTQLRLIKEEGT
jgi:hypothetical protein